MRIFILLLFIPPFYLNAQGPNADFLINGTACIDEQLSIENLSTSADEFEWDFCQGDLLQTPIGTSLLNIGGNITVGIDIEQDGSNWFGFITSRETNSIIRLDFGTDLNSTPTIVNLGNVGGVSPWRPIDINIINENGLWYGFVLGESSNQVTRIDFGENLNAAPATINAEVIFSAPGAESTNGLDLVKTGTTEWMMVLTNPFSVSVLRLSNITSVPVGADQLLGVGITGANGLGDIKIVKNDIHWFAYIPSVFNSKFLKLSFGTTLFSVPLVEDITTAAFTGLSPYGVDIGFDNGSFTGFVSTLQGNLIRVNLGQDLNQIPVSTSAMGTLSVLANTLKLCLVKQNSNWIGMSVSWDQGRLYRMSFPQPTCEVSFSSLSDLNPQIRFLSAGTKFISLHVKGSGIRDEEHRSVVVNNLSAPVIDFQNTSLCVQSGIPFVLSNDQTLNTIGWDFGDGTLSPDETPIHNYIAGGAYNVTLSVVSTNGCNNFLRKTIKIYTPPSASFSLPTGLICTNNEFTFVNSTVDNFDGNLSFQWLLDDVPVSTDEDLLLTFNSGGDKEITLQASIPGCSSESVQIVTGVGEGPTVDFTLTGNCLNESTLLTNNSQGAIAGYSWDFGDGQTSTDLNPTVNYTAAGNYTVELETLGSNGCISKKSLPHQIFSVPQPNFNIDLPPFSCNGTPTQFNDLTPTLIDSNLDTWQWNFADQNASASIQHPQYTYALSGDYNVSLTVTSDQGCVATTNKTITIAQSPLPVIVNTPACVETAVVLQDGTATSASAWQWQVGNNFYFTESPSHVFATPGDYEISLTLTASNGCVRTTTKQVAVPLPLTVNFESAFNCANTATQFTAVVNDVADPVTNHTWFFGDDMRSGATVNYLYNAPGTEEVQLIATTQNGCAYTITKAITILPAPVADFSFTPGSGAPPLAVTFTNQSVNANSFLWKFNDAANTTSSLQSPAFTFTDFGEYAVDLTAKNSAGCESTVSKLIAVALPRINVTLDNFRIIPNTDGSFLLLTNILNNGNVLVQNPKIEIQLDNAATLQEVLNTNIVAGASVDYTLSTLVGANNNLNYACIRLVLPNNEAQENTEACITFEANTAITSPYPNPANELVTVEWISPTEESVSVMVNDYLGNVMATETISSQQGLNTLKLQTLDWQAGIYFIRIRSNSREHFFRTIIAR